MTDYITKRPRYYNGQFLIDTDFGDEQSHHRNRQMLHDRMQHLGGIAEGLAVTLSPSPLGTVVIAAGAALDGDGNRILLDAATTRSFEELGDGTWYLVIRFNEVESDPADPQYVPGNTRFTQEPAFSFEASRAPGDVVLATLTLPGTTGPELGAGDRTYAGLRLNGPGDAGFDLRSRGDGALVLERYLAGDTSFTPLLHVPSAGGLGVGAAPAPGTLLAVGPNNELQIDASGNLSTSGTTTLSALAPDAAVFTDAQSNLASGTLDVPRGGTGATSLVGVLTGNGTSAVTAVTGAPDRVARWSTSNTLATGGLYDDGINAGVVEGMFTVGPGAEFQVNASGAVLATGITCSGPVNLPSLPPQAAVFTSPSGILMSGVLPVPMGGTGNTELMGVLKGNGMGPFSAMSGIMGRSVRWSDETTLGAGALFDDGVRVSIGAPPLGSEMFTVGSMAQFRVTDDGVLSVPQIVFPLPPTNILPAITARTIPFGQGGAPERTELILFHGSDGFMGPERDTITLRAPQIRLQTFGDPWVQDIENDLGSIDQLVIDPTGLVTVTGDIQARGGHSVAVGDSEQLRILRGTVEVNGMVRTGTGFSVSRPGPIGVYQINFFTPFSDAPTVVITLISPDSINSSGSSQNTLENAVIIGISPMAVRIKTGNQSGSGQDRPFCFMAMG
jgi:hypothetical protein